MSPEPTTSGDPAAPEGAAGGLLEQARERREELTAAHARKRELQAEIRKLGKRIEELDPVVQDDFVNLGTDSMRAVIDDQRYTLALKPELRAGPVKTDVSDSGEPSASDEDWVRACDAARAAGWGDLVREQFNGNAFSARLREFKAEHGPNWRDELPDEFDGAIEIHAGTKISVTKA